MTDRGRRTKAFVERGAMVLSPVSDAMGVAVTWSVAENPTIWLPRIDAIAMEVIKDAADPRMKWLRLAPRYLRQNLAHERFVRMRKEEGTCFQERLMQGKISVPRTLESRGRFST